MSSKSIDETQPKADLAQIEAFEKKRCGYFADDYSKTAMYWESLCDAMRENDGSTGQVLTYIAGKLETDRSYTASIYANADAVFGDKKGTAKLRHDKIRQAELKAKLKGQKPPVVEDASVAGGAGRSDYPTNGTNKAIWEMAEMDCRAARYRDVLCDTLEEEDLLGKVKTMGRETHKRFAELIAEGEACLLSLRNIDKEVGLSFVHLKEVLGNQLGGQKLHEDIWFLDTRYRTAVVHQKEAWAAVNAKLRETFAKMKDLEAHRRHVLREFMIDANSAIGNSWRMLPTLCAPANDSATAVRANRDAVDDDAANRITAGALEKREASAKDFQLENITNLNPANPPPADMSFINSLTAPLESPLVRSMMMIERRSGKAIGSKYYTGLMVLSWQGFIHFFDVPASTGLTKEVSPAAAFQGISPCISLDDLVANKKDLDEVLMFKSSHTLQLDEDSYVEGLPSKTNQHKIEVKGKTQLTSIRRHFGSGSTSKSVTFRTTDEAEMNHAIEHIKAAIQSAGGMLDENEDGLRKGSSGRSSFGSVASDASTKENPAEDVAPAYSVTSEYGSAAETAKGKATLSTEESGLVEAVKEKASVSEKPE